MATSMNGYPVLFENRTTGSLPRLRKWVIPGTDRHLILRDGSAGFVLAHCALWYHESVERLDNSTWDEWGWAVRPVRGKTSGYSNHSSGTAMDLNATKHPLGVRTSNTYTARQIRLIHARLRWYGGVVRWGGDYQNRPDAMHFELNKPIGPTERLARKLIYTPRGKRLLRANDGAKRIIMS